MKISIALFIVFSLTQIGDFYTTYRALQKPGTVEANPVVKWLMDRIGVIGALLIMKGLAVGIIGAALYFFPSIYLWVAVGVIILGYCWVVRNNWLNT